MSAPDRLRRFAGGEPLRRVWPDAPVALDALRADVRSLIVETEPGVASRQCDSGASHTPERITSEHTPLRIALARPHTELDETGHSKDGACPKCDGYQCVFPLPAWPLTRRAQDGSLACYRQGDRPMTAFGALIRRHRGALSLSEAAKGIGCTKAHLWELETGQSRNPTVRTLVGMAAAFGVSVAELAEAAARALNPPTPGRPSEP